MAEPLTSGICTECFGLIECSGDVYMTLHVHMDSCKRANEVLKSLQATDAGITRLIVLDGDNSERYSPDNRDDTAICGPSSIIARICSISYNSTNITTCNNK